MRFVAVKTVDQQGALMLHKTRDLLVRQRTILINGLRGHLAEFGIIAAGGNLLRAWLGLTPKAHSSAGKERHVGISKQGDGYIRRLLVVGATAVMRRARQDNGSRLWGAKLLERKYAKLAAVVLANKTARIAWAVITRGETYAAPAVYHSFLAG